MKKIITFLFIALIFTSCSSDDDDINPVAGKWKLVRISALSEVPDISGQIITYTFDGHSGLTISRNGQLEHLKYEYKLDYLGPNLEGIKGRVPLVIFENSVFIFSAADGKMNLSQSYTDGPNYYFEKVNF